MNIFVDATLTVENVAAIVIHWAPRDWKHTFSHCRRTVRDKYGMPFIPHAVLDKIEKTYESIRECYKECARCYTNYHPDTSWENLATFVYEIAMLADDDKTRDKHLECLRQLSPFLPPHG